jgi:NIMA (never in mitosis gene a)-related kinase 1/4/5
MEEKYTMIKVLGEGSFGKCYLVETASDKARCVIKQIDIKHMSPEEKEETIREALILRNLSHPNIIRFRNAYTTKKQKLCIVMDFADGGDLQGKIKERSGRLFNEDQIIDWFVQICLGIKHVHDRKILHRDLKSQNIFLTRTGRIKLGDFGIAKVLSATVDNASTMVGTPYYLSPEIVESRPYNFKSDIWSLGVLLYELCSLKPPFDASSLHFLALKIVRGVYPPLSKTFSQPLRTLVSKMLKVDPNARPNIHQILREPLIRNRIKNFLSANERMQEFSHTIIHNYSILNNLPDTPENFVKNSEEEKKSNEIKQEMLKSVRELKIELKNREEIDREQQEEGIMICEMNEIVLSSEYDQESVSVHSSVVEVPPDRDDEIEDNQEEQKIEKVPEVEIDENKVSLMRKYLTGILGKKVLNESIEIIDSLITTMDELEFESLFPHLEHIMSRELQIEYVPIIYSLIELQRGNSA